MHDADATNAFAEDTPPIAPLHVTIDEQHKNWNNNHRKLLHTLDGRVLPALQASQGHPEYPFSWSEYTHKILLALNFKSCPPPRTMLVCEEFKGQRMMFLRQIDDLAIASPNKEHEYSFLDTLDGYLKQKLKLQGILSSFNGLDVQQNTWHIKISCSSHLTKILRGHNWLTSNSIHAKSPMSNDSKTLKSTYTSKVPINTSDAAKTQLKWASSIVKPSEN